MEIDIFTAFTYLCCAFSTLLVAIVLCLPLRGRFDHVLVFNKKVGAKYWGFYEGAAGVREQSTIEVMDPFYTDKITFGSAGYSSGSKGHM